MAAPAYYHSLPVHPLFRAGNERFGTVYLPITERSETARLADLLD